jgi:hypothetical protein
MDRPYEWAGAANILCRRSARRLPKASEVCEMKTQWITSAYDPSKAPAPRPKMIDGTPLSSDALEVLGAVKKGYLTIRGAYSHLSIPRAKVVAGHHELINKGLLIAIGQGGARRYLVNKSIG